MFKKQEITLYNAVTPVAVTSSTDATPIVVTATTHGLSTGDRVLIYGHATNTNANGIFKVTVVNANSFQLQDEITGANIAGSGGGAGSGGVLVKAPPVLLVSDFRSINLQVSTSGTATVTLKIPGSLGKPLAQESSPRYDYPNMGATVSPANPYRFLQIVDLEDNSAKDGDTGIVVAGTDINNQYEVNVNSTKYVTVIPVSWTQGAITVKALLTSTD